jgi:lipoprotein-anchoring transpeptidase ErfK/SrfK
MPHRRPRKVLPAGALAFAIVAAWGCAPATAVAKARYEASYQEPRHHATKHQDTGHANKEPFGDIPKGPLQIFISINQQKLHLYSDGAHVADTSVATGVPSLPTPLGVFDVIQKQVFHRSNIYSNAPMPFMQRITWSGVALHEGENIGHPASHGCIRMPHDFAARLYGLTKLGARVIISRSELKPVEFADPHLFVHKDRPPDPIAAPTPSVKTAQSADGSKAIDAAPADAVAPARPAELGLRVSADAGPARPNSGIGDAPKSSAPTTAPNMPASTALDPTVGPPVPDGGAAAAPAKPAEMAKAAAAKKTPISIFVSRKEKTIYVRQDFEPLFDAAVTIAHPDEPLGTHVFTAMNFLDDHTTLRWTVVSLPGEPPKPARKSETEQKFEQHANGRRRIGDGEKATADPPPLQSPAAALARIEIPQDAIDMISQLLVPSSSLIVSDQGLGDETGEGTDFIVVAR